MTRDEWDISRGPHRPLHWYEDGSCYWITAATLQHAPYLRLDSRKQSFVDEMYEGAREWAVEVAAWTLLHDHYHAIFYVAIGRALPRFLGRLHGRTAILVNKQEGTRGRQVWRQYWDTHIRSEGDFWSRVNYIWWNAVRHGLCERPQDWPWTNLGALMAAAGEPARAAMARFPAPRKLPGDVW